MEARARAGTQALRLLATPVDFHVLRVLAGGPHTLMDLRRETGSPPQTTIRGHLRGLAATDVVTRRQLNAFPGSVDFELLAPGEELWQVAEVLTSWLRAAPDRPLAPGSKAAQSAVKALVEGWETNMVRALAARPLSLTELSRLIGGVSYPSLERRLGALALAGLIERVPEPGRRSPYAASEWLRRAIGPLVTAVRWERRNVSAEAPPIKRLDAETMFLLTLPLLELPADLSGSCRLMVEFKTAKGPALAGVSADVRAGRIVSCATGASGQADAWVSGATGAWLRAMAAQELEGLEVGGDGQLARAVLSGIHDALFRNVA